MEKRKINIGVTGLNNIDSPGSGIPVIRGLKESLLFDCRIIGLSYENLEPGMYMHDLVDKTYQIPLPGTGQDSLITRLKYINDIEKLDVIIPNFDSELFNFIKIEEKLSDMGIRMFLPTLEQFEARHKANLNEFGENCGISVPKSKMIFSTNEIPTLLRDFSFPYVVKGKFYDAGIAFNQEQAVSQFNRISAKWGLPIIIQQFIYGTEVNVTAVGDGTGKMVGAVPMRKKFITDKGKAWAGITLEDKKLLDLTAKVIKKTKWRGPLEMEMMKTSNDEYYLMEINPRFPAWVYLSVGAGQNHPEMLLQLALGEKVKTLKDYSTGKLFIRYSFDLIRDIKEFEKISTTGEL